MSQATSPGSITWANGAAIGVLVVDDEPVVAEQLAQGLAAHGLRTGFVHNATDALARLDADPGIGVVVTDIRMPGGDGLGLAQKILSQRPASAAVEVIIITGHATIDDATAAVRTGVADFLRKPFRLAEAVQAVTKAMARVVQRSARAGPGQTAGTWRRTLSGRSTGRPSGSAGAGSGAAAPLAQRAALAHRLAKGNAHIRAVFALGSLTFSCGTERFKFQISSRQSRGRKKQRGEQEVTHGRNQ